MTTDAAIRTLEESIRACTDHSRLFDLYGRLGQLQALAGWKLFAPPPPPDRLLTAEEQTASLLALAVTQRDDALLEAKRARADAHAQANLNVDLLDKLAAVRRYADECRVRTGAQLDALTVAATLRGLVGEGK